MKGNLTAYFSNQLELLYHILKVQLFEDQNPFTKRLIIVPSQAIKSWLMFQLAEDPDLKIATGIEISYLDQGLKKIQEVLTKDPYPEFPDKLTLSFRIEDQLKSNIQEKTLGFLELKKYLHLLSKGDFSSPKSQRRLIHLADQLAYLFQNYAIYGKKMIQEWEEKPVCWQSYLWKSLKLINENPVITATGNFQIFVFAMSFIPFDHFLYFQKVAQKISVKFYQLSPSQPYWGDVLSDKESQWLLKKNLPQQKAWEVFLQDRNPLLANFGKLGRQMLLSFEKIGAEKFSRYFIPKSLENYSCLYEFDPNEIISIENHQPLNCLQAVQADILTIRNPQLHPKISFAQEDDSIQLHEASSKLKEVEILYDQIVSIIEKHPKQISAKDILVMAPNMMDYAPYVKIVFGKRESSLDFQIMDLNIPSQSSLVQAFLHLLHLVEGKWDSNGILELLNFPCFLNKHHFKPEDVVKIKKWTYQTDVRWGVDEDHRKQILKKYHGKEAHFSERIGTWHFAWERLLDELICPVDEEVSIDQKDAPILGKWMQILLCLREDLKPIIQGNEKSLLEWSFFLKRILEDYLEEENTEEKLLLVKFFEEIAWIDTSLKSLFPFQSILTRLEEYLEKQQLIYRESHIYSIKFCSLLPMRAIPAPVVALMGMNFGEFPKVEKRNSLNLLQLFSHKDYQPTQTDYDRYLFLEAIISARQYLLISFVGYQLTDSKSKPPSILITELIDYLDQFYQFGNEKFSDRHWLKHPFSRFDPEYFKKDSPFKNYSQNDFLKCKAFLSPSKHITHHFIKDFKHLSLNEQQIHKVKIKDLVSFAKDPLRTYFNQTLKIYLKQDQELKEEDDFELDQLALFDLKKLSLKFLPQEIIHKARRQGKIPQGFFEEIALTKIQQELNKIDSHKKNLNIHSGNIFKITLAEDIREVTQEEKEWFVPALSIPSLQGHFIISGEIPLVCSQGLISLQKDKKEEICKILPEILIYHLIIDRHQLELPKTLLLPREGTFKNFNFPSEILLKNYLTYYLMALKAPSPLIPEWINHFLEENFEKHSENSLETILTIDDQTYNIYLKWLSQNSCTAFKSVDPEWKFWADNIYGKFLMNWNAEKVCANEDK